MSVAEGSLIDFGLGQLATLAPFLLWLIASNLFVDESKKHTLAWLALALCYALDIYGAVVYSGHEGPGSNVILDFSFNLLPQLILLSFPLHAIYLAMRGYGVDLLEERRKFRIAFIAGLAEHVGVLEYKASSRSQFRVDPSRDPHED